MKKRSIMSLIFCYKENKKEKNKKPAWCFEDLLESRNINCLNVVRIYEHSPALQQRNVSSFLQQMFYLLLFISI